MGSDAKIRAKWIPEVSAWGGEGQRVTTPLLLFFPLMPYWKCQTHHVWTSDYCSVWHTAVSPLPAERLRRKCEHADPQAYPLVRVGLRPPSIPACPASEAFWGSDSVWFLCFSSSSSFPPLLSLLPRPFSCLFLLLLRLVFPSPIRLGIPCSAFRRPFFRGAHEEASRCGSNVDTDEAISSANYRVVVLLLLAVAVAVEVKERGDGYCKLKNGLTPRPHSVTITEFGAVGDGVTLNTVAFQNAVFYVRSFADKGGAQLYVPKGRWLTGSFNLTSHLTLFLDEDAVIIGSQDASQWPTVEPLPSYGQGIDLPGERHRSLINGYNLTDVVITGMLL
ncbi:hypothetical protein C4D60_Mb11t15920 [Musa balbisiana]|uniref:Uncharacterized protein n=1 Tax=Musa balbisiana TaxID=52838 RepID=A0A4S8J5D3_MUSBA|nr:hypothetical protein C4D60_Mb11t15920 [Musa balbisiana]